MKRIFSLIAVIALISSSMLLAHDPSRHKGKSITGTVEKLTDNGVELKTEKGVQTIVFNDKTSFERGDHKITRADVKVNGHLIVFGTTLATGEVVAKEVLLSEAKTGTANQTPHKH